MNAVDPAPARLRAVEQDFVAAHTPRASGLRDFLLHATMEGWSSGRPPPGVPESRIRALPPGGRASRLMDDILLPGAEQITVGMWENNSIINLHLLTGQIR